MLCHCYNEAVSVGFTWLTHLTSELYGLSFSQFPLIMHILLRVPQRRWVLAGTKGPQVAPETSLKVIDLDDVVA